ncbi:NupC/NupG family nucleoside CNT transporter [Photobacterium carnosum]|uniref:Nucleoside permease n=1 Tax=Photobacterium carnosum TaxID=2023717 RepID=A0A2N4UNZ6_9GAMM|nr:NupC/NupG family nucleoside CNT transporter [Photobacterium carnosum]KAE8176007.1 NupC/NupG family nucleoside CNT transporter [Photobacterium carnosum]MBY3789856.1 NupC/NupG family nucleoside CNT transporter [Photobacterium carnosum]MCD9496487.1 NupC/NupG family nucleoside CNT transporter [Photobacterium carnosum]MCD9498316.1 NupC/NupG family nucleoside CNT transporter [Photobacterium carnosum]MCD9515963.1 NupC/NupG family nucleoside CNT transporter [Photobacterium carnosum]
MHYLIGILGIFVIFVVGFLFSENRSAVNWRSVLGAFCIQVLFAAFILYVPVGRVVLNSVSGAVSGVIEYGHEGTSFLFGQLAQFKLGFIFAVNVLPSIVFFSALISVLYYVGIMKWVIRGIGGLLQRLLGTTRTESMSATANIFVGSVEAPLVVRPFLARMTRSELFAVMVGGLASVAGGTMVGYAGLGVQLKYLIAASFMSAPAGLMMAKLVVPQTEGVHSMEDEDDGEEDEPVNLVDAASRGALSGLQIAMAVGASLLAVISLIAMVNGGLGHIGHWIGINDLSLNLIFGYLFAPVAWLIGVPWSEATTAASLIGTKIAVNEFIAFAELMKPETLAKLSEHSQAIVTFALCGFANLTSIAMLMGGLGGIVPKRRPEIARLGMKAIFAATLANLMSATLAGLFLPV